MSDKVVAVVQARMGSTRLPNKMMLWLNGYPVIEWVRRRLGRCDELDAVVYAIPWTSENDVLYDCLQKHGACSIYRGDEEDVLTRMFNAVRPYHPRFVVRVCADNPLISPWVVDHLISIAQRANWDEQHCPMYMSNNGYHFWPDGLGAELVSFDAFRKIFLNVRYIGYREHVFEGILRNKHSNWLFRPPDDLHHPELKLDLDTYEDYQRLLASGVDIDMTAAEIVECFL